MSHAKTHLPLLLNTLSDLRDYVVGLRRNGKTIGFVPTMGALHDGHLHLAHTALTACDNCIVSIFVNPKQFAPHEDFDKYPRNLDHDRALCGSVGVDAIFAPSVDVMYPPNFQTQVTLGGIAAPLEGECRPHFFAGVATVVTRLLLLVGADQAFFGEKDYQQLQVIKALARDLAIPTHIVGVATVRDDATGLALSSRNAYLTTEERAIAITLNRTLFAMADKIRAVVDINTVEEWGLQQLRQNGFGKIDYLTVRDATTLTPPHTATESLRILAAAWLGSTRLIDNIGV